MTLEKQAAHPATQKGIHSSYCILPFSAILSHLISGPVPILRVCMGTCLLRSNRNMGNGGYPLFSLKLVQQMLAVVQLLALFLQVLEEVLQESWVYPLGPKERKRLCFIFVRQRESKVTPSSPRCFAAPVVFGPLVEHLLTSSPHVSGPQQQLKQPKVAAGNG